MAIKRSTALLLAVFGFFVFMVLAFIEPLSLVGLGYTTISYTHSCLDFEDGICIEETPSLSSGGFIFSPSSPFLTKEGEASYPATELVTNTYDRQLAGQDRETVTESTVQTKLRTTDNVPSRYWRANVNIAGKEYTFEKGEQKLISEHIIVVLEDIYAKYDGADLEGWETKWTIGFSENAFFSEIITPQNEIEFTLPYTAQVSLVNLLGYELDGGIEGKVEEISLFMQTEFIEIDHVLQVKEGCTIIPISIPTDQIGKVQVQFNPIIKFNGGQIIKGKSVMHIFKRTVNPTQDVIVPYICPSTITTSAMMAEQQQTDGNMKVRAGWWVILGIIVFLTGVLIYAWRKR